MNRTPIYGHAVVIGGSIAGLTAARVLSDHFQQVTIVERDTPPEPAAFRKGAPQTRHPHALLKRGELILEEMFPGLVAELLTNGAITANFGDEVGFYLSGSWISPFSSAITFTSCSRPLLESTVYRKLTALPNVRVLHQHEMQGLLLDSHNERVTGVRLTDRSGPAPKELEVPAALVVDASGRTSKAPHWLKEWGYTPPAETEINAFTGYATRIYRKPDDYTSKWKAVYMMAMAPQTPRGAVILPMEGDRWHVSLIGVGRDYPPQEEAAFLEFLRGLPSSIFYDALRNAEPITEIYGYRDASNRMRYYEKLPRYIDGFVVTGDAVYAFNPIYGQGMTTAALSAQALDRCLREQRAMISTEHLNGLARRFQKGLAGVIAAPWQLATGQDIRWPTTVGGARPDPATRLLQGYLDKVLAVAPHDPLVAEAFIQVQSMLKGPESLFHPKVLWQVLKPQAPRTGYQPGPVRSARDAVAA